MGARLLIAAMLLSGAVPEPGHANDAWYLGRMSDLTIFACARPVCSSDTTVAVTDPVTRALPVAKHMLDDAVLAARMADGLALGIGRSDVVIPFRRADLGAHMGFLGVVRTDNGSHMAAYVSFHENRSRDFMATAGSIREAIDAIVVIAGRVPLP